MGSGERRQSSVTTFRVAGSSRDTRSHTTHTCGPYIPQDNGPGREIVYPGSLRPDIVIYISYDTTDFLQAEGHIALTCPADLILTLTPTITNKPTQTIHLLITRANQRAPLLVDDFLLCLRKLIAWLEDREVSRIHFPILDPERPAYSSANLYRVMMDLFVDTNIHVALHKHEVGVRPP